MMEVNGKVILLYFKCSPLHLILYCYFRITGEQYYTYLGLYKTENQLLCLQKAYKSDWL